MIPIRLIMRPLIPIAGALGVAVLLILLVGENPFEALWAIVDGGIGSTSRLGDTLTAWTTLSLAAAGLAITFTAGLWNIGVEGQVIAGAIAASFVAREIAAPTPVMIILTLVAGFIGGAAWALLAGLLKVKGRVNEIFGGLGLTFVAISLSTYLIIGPWQREGIASTSGTDPFPDDAWLPTFGDLRVSLVSIVVAVLALIAVYVLLRGTRFGLRLRAVGQNLQSSALFGIANTRYLLTAFMLGGGLAGLAGAIRVTGFYHKLVPGPGGGHGYLGILIILLAAYKAKWIAPLAFFFAIVSVGASQLPLRLQIDASLGGIVRSVLVLFVLLAGGWQARRAARRRDDEIEEVTA
ncbi:MAG: ABC transporter permease [bacterium]|nr:ABC transporter permease [bacterium]